MLRPTFLFFTRDSAETSVFARSLSGLLPTYFIFYPVPNAEIWMIIPARVPLNMYASVMALISVYALHSRYEWRPLMCQGL